MAGETRRSLQFDTLQEVTEDARHLLNAGYKRCGQWNLSQACGHLTNWLSYPMDGFPPAPLPIRMMLNLMRLTVGKRQLKKILTNNGFPAGGPTMPDSVPPPDQASDAIAVDQLEAAIRRFGEYTGPIHRSPVFGDMDKETLTRLHLIHCAHHLSFFSSKDDSA